MIAQEGGTQMLYGVNLCGVHDRLFIGAGHAEVEGGDGFCADFVLAGNIDTGLQSDVVYGEACDFFHNYGFLSIVFRSHDFMSP